MNFEKKDKNFLTVTLNNSCCFPFHPCEELIVTKASLPSASSFKRASLLTLKNDKEEQRNNTT